MEKINQIIAQRSWTLPKNLLNIANKVNEFKIYIIENTNLKKKQQIFGRKILWLPRQ